MTQRKDIYQKMIDKIRINRISCTEIADCLGKTGAINGMRPMFSLDKDYFRVGKVFLAYAYNESNWPVHEQIHYAVKNGNLQRGAVVVVESHNCGERAIFGELVTKYLVRYNLAEAVVVNGFVRDVPNIVKEGYPVWAQNATPIGCFNVKPTKPLDKKIVDEWRKKYEGAIAVCDTGGVVLIPRARINGEFLDRLDHIENLEDAWFDSIDVAGLTTYEAVCKKRYEKDPNVLIGPIKRNMRKLKQFAKRTKS